MKIFVIGGGGREHALVWKIAHSPLTTKIWCAPGNAGIAQEQVLSTGEYVECVPIQPEQLDKLLDFAKCKKPDLTIVGPDNPLGMGIVDLFESAGLKIWGPHKKAALFESSKIFAHAFMQKYRIPSPIGEAFENPEAAIQYAAILKGKCAVKADGLALGKGVIVCHNMEEAVSAIKRLLIEREFGEASARILIQELVEGIELSLHAMCDGTHVVLFPPSQDHKRVGDGDIGPNTGGMGTYSPVPFVKDKDLKIAQQQIIERWLEGCKSEGIFFRGLLYPGVMLTDKGPQVLEFNVRFGDPETQVYMVRLESDLLEIILSCMEGNLRKELFKWSEKAAVCVIMASHGYPYKYEKGKKIYGLDEVTKAKDVKIFHAGTAMSNGNIVTNGGRVLGITAIGNSIKEARQKAYEAVAMIKFEGAFYRKDIALKAEHFCSL